MWPAWEVREGGVATSWFQVRLAFADGACVELLAVVRDGRVSVEDVRARPPLTFDDLTVLADWIAGPLFDRCDAGGVHAEDTRSARHPRDGRDGRDERDERDGHDAPHSSDPVGTAGAPDAPSAAADAGGEQAGAGRAFDGRRGRPARPRGVEGRRLVAQEYRAAQEAGVDPVLAVMCATGHSRRRSLRLIAQARDAGYLTPRHARR
nr:DUF6214 family protein [Streptomyces sp. LUP30]